MLPLISASLLDARRCSDLANPLWLNSRLFIELCGHTARKHHAAATGQEQTFTASAQMPASDLVRNVAQVDYS